MALLFLSVLGQLRVLRLWGISLLDRLAQESADRSKCPKETHQRIQARPVGQFEFYNRVTFLTEEWRE